MGKEKLEGQETHEEEIGWLKWKQRDTSGKVWSDWHRTELHGGVLLVAFVPIGSKGTDHFNTEWGGAGIYLKKNIYSNLSNFFHSAMDRKKTDSTFLQLLNNVDFQVFF